MVHRRLPDRGDKVGTAKHTQKIFLSISRRTLILDPYSSKRYVNDETGWHAPRERKTYRNHTKQALTRIQAMGLSWKHFITTCRVAYVPSWCRSERSARPSAAWWKHPSSQKKMTSFRWVIPASKKRIFRHIKHREQVILNGKYSPRRRHPRVV